MFTSWRRTSSCIECVGLVSYAVIGLICEGDESPLKPFCCALWSGSQGAPVDVQIYISADWRLSAPKKDVSYLEELLRDWSRMVRQNPDTLLALMGELSVGPLQVVEYGAISTDEVALALIEKLSTPVCISTNEPPDQ